MVWTRGENEGSPSKHHHGLTEDTILHDEEEQGRRRGRPRQWVNNGGPRKGPSAESVRDEPSENWKKRVSRVTIDSFVYGNRDSGHPPELT